MTRTAATSSAGASHFAERQMRSWALALQSQERLAELKAMPPQSLRQQILPYVAITREASTGEKKITETIKAGGFSHVRRATATPFNMILEAIL